MKKRSAAFIFAFAAFAALCAGLCACTKKGVGAAAGNVAINAEKVHTEGGLVYRLKSNNGSAYYAVEAENNNITSAQVLSELNSLPVTCVAEDGFASCYLLTEITLSENLTKIGSNAFNGCSGLLSITLPKTLTDIGDDAFKNCYKLWQVYNFSSLDIKQYNASFGMVAYNARAVYTSVGESIYTRQGDFTFYVGEKENYLLSYVGSSSSVTLPQSFGGEDYEVADYCFYRRSDITALSVPSAVKSIASYAFYGCEALVDLTFETSYEKSSGK